MSLSKQVIILLLVIGLQTACSGTRPYPTRPENNVQVSAATKGGILTSIDADLDIYAVDKACQLDYLGSVELSAAASTIGLPHALPRYLKFRFYRSSLLAGSSGSISYETLFTPRKGQRYTMEASYRDRIYNVIIKDAAGKEIEPRALKDCRPR